MLLHIFVIALNIPYAGVAKGLVTLEHLRHSPAQRTCRLAGIGHHRHQQMGNAGILAKLHFFRVNQYQLHLIRLGTIQNRHNNAVHTHGLTGTGGTGDQQMGHLCHIAVHRIAGNIPSKAHRQHRPLLAKLRRVDQLAHRYAAFYGIGHLDTHRRFTGNGGLNTHMGGRQIQSNIVGQIGDFRNTHTGSRFQLIPGHGGTAANVRNGSVHIKGMEGVDQPLRIGFQLPAHIFYRLMLGRGQQGYRRQLIICHTRFHLGIRDGKDFRRIRFLRIGLLGGLVHNLIQGLGLFRGRLFFLCNFFAVLLVQFFYNTVCIHSVRILLFAFLRRRLLLRLLFAGGVRVQGHINIGLAALPVHLNGIPCLFVGLLGRLCRAV